MAKPTDVKVDKYMEKPWARVNKMERITFWNKSAYPPMNIETNKNERSRVAQEMTAEQRTLRVQWLQDQKLHHPPRNIKIRPYNFFRRIYMKPLNYFEDFMHPKVGAMPAWLSRKFLGMMGLTYCAGVVGWYYLKYHESNWERAFGMNFVPRKPRQDDLKHIPNYIMERSKQQKDATMFATAGFNTRSVLLYKPGKNEGEMW